MPKVGHIAKARQRYQMKPVLDQETGKPKQIATSRKNRRTGEPIMRTVTEPDLTKPITLHCNYPACPVEGKVIEVGTPFQNIKIRRQFGNVEYFRHESCPTWQPWEYTDALWARIAQIQSEEFDVGDIVPDDADSGIQDAVSNIIELIRDLASEKEESFSNMPEGLQQGDTGQMLEQAYQSLEDWASEFEQISAPDAPESECLECEGTGEIGEGDDAKTCENCEEGQVEPSDEELEAWREEIREGIQGVLDNAPEV